MSEKTVVVALGHKALGTTLPEQKLATRETAKAIADLVEEGANVVISHSNGPQVGMIHTAMNEFGKAHPDYTFAPMSVCSAMSQGYIGYDLQNAIRAELISRGIYKPVATVLTQVVIDPYDDAFAEPEKIIGRVLTKEEAEAEEHKGNFVTELEDGTYKRILAAPKPILPGLRYFPSDPAIPGLPAVPYGSSANLHGNSWKSNVLPAVRATFPG